MSQLNGELEAVGSRLLGDRVISLQVLQQSKRVKREDVACLIAETTRYTQRLLEVGTRPGHVTIVDFHIAYVDECECNRKPVSELNEQLQTGRVVTAPVEPSINECYSALGMQTRP